MTRTWLFVLAACGGSHHETPAVDAPPSPDGRTPDGPPPPFGFGPHQDLAVGMGPVALAIGDLDGDGRADIAVANAASSTLSIVRNTAQGFAVAPEITLGASPGAIALADFNGDGKIDVAVAGSTRTLTILLNATTSTGSLAFASAVDFALLSGLPGLAIGDVNRDGKPDVVVSYFCSTSTSCLSVLLDSTPTGATTPAFEIRNDFVTTERANTLAVGDLDGDGAADVFLPYRSEHVGVFVNQTAADATAAMLASQDVAVSSSNGNCGAIVDLDGDGRAEVAYCGADVTVLPNATTAAGAPAFGAAVDVMAAGGLGLAAGDIDGDGKIDLAVVDNFHSAIVSVRNTGGMTFATPRSDAVGMSPRALALGDLDGDGRADAVTANFGDNTISVLLAR